MDDSCIYSCDHSAVCDTEAEAFQRLADGPSAEKAETQENSERIHPEYPFTKAQARKNCEDGRPEYPFGVGVDVPGVGRVPAGETTEKQKRASDPSHSQSSQEFARLMSLYSALIQMGHAGVELAMSNIVRLRALDGSFYRDKTECSECGAVSDSSGALTHDPDCQTGIVLALACQFSSSTDRYFAPPMPRGMEATPQAPRLKITANYDTTPGSFGEPWTIVGWDVNRQIVSLGCGSGIAAHVFELSGPFPAVLAASRRLVNCLNASVGIADDVLLKATGVEHFLVRVVDRERFTDFAAAWASIEDAPCQPKGGVQ
jgi:hypothetical protein